MNWLTSPTIPDFFEKAEATFRRIVLGLGNGSEQRMDIDRLLDYFAELQRYESRGTLARPRGVRGTLAYRLK